MATDTLEDRVAERYAGLSAQMRKAADYVLANPLEVASRSLRAVSAESDVSPATFSRLSRALGYASFEEMKDISRLSVDRTVTTMSERAERLRTGGQTGHTMLQRQSAACIANIESFVAKADEARLSAAAAALQSAEQVVLVGALSSKGIADYMAYLAQYFAPNWSQAGTLGSSIGGKMARLTRHDAVLVITKSPYAERAVKAAQIARDRGATVLVVTDSYTCPALAVADHGFVVPTDSPQFFSSYVVTLVLIETLIAMIVAGSEADATSAIRQVEAQNQVLGEYWAG